MILLRKKSSNIDAVYFCTTDGKAYRDDGTVTDFSNKDFFKEIIVNGNYEYISNPEIDEETRKLEQLKQIYSKENIEIFTKKQIKPYSRKNFYVNAGKWFSDKIEWLIDDKKIRESIKKFRKFDDKLSSTNEEIEEDDEQIPENEINGNAPPQYQKNTK